MKQINWKALVISLALSLGAGAVSAFLTRNSMEVYQLYRPSLAPPGWLFPIVWTILYTLMGVAAYLIYVSDSSQEEKKAALREYAAQLLVNSIWPILFFSLKAYLLAFVWLLLLWYLIFMTIQYFKPIDALAAKLLYPYLAWVSFAGYLNLAIAVAAG